MNCPNCNSEVKDGMKFCPKCGTEIPQIRFCPKCGTGLKDVMRFCSKCGSAIEDSNRGDAVFNDSSPKSSEITCPICNHPLTIDDKICPNCHRELCYNCNSCGNDITYGEIIKNKGCCPKCGIRIGNLYNIPNEKYPFARNIEISGNTNNSVNNSNENYSESGGGKTKKYVKGCLISILIWFGISFVFSLFEHNGGGGIDTRKTDTEIRRDIMDELYSRGYTDNRGVTLLDKSPYGDGFQVDYKSTVGVGGVTMQIDGTAYFDKIGSLDQISVGVPHR